MIQEVKKVKDGEKVCKQCGGYGLVNIGENRPIVVPCGACNPNNKKKLKFKVNGDYTRFRQTI